ncbi:Ig-like domain-containing protein, partial [Paenibacillus sepulcri]|nr:Ig-like domain-containing protein [Paenibacillus sepulcri]
KVISTVPGSSAEGVSNGTKLSLTFDEPISAVAGRTIVVSRAEDDSPVEAVDASNPDRVTITGLTATIRLSSGLSYGTAYNIKVAPGAFKDAAGNDYAGITSRGAWTFTTAREAIDPDPGADATLKGLNVYAGAEFLPISPAFGRNTRDYAISLPNSVAGLTVTASVYESRAGMTVSMYDDSRRLISGPFPLADGQASGTLPVDLGRSRIELNVLAEDGTAQAYNIMVTRAAVYDVPPAEPPPE